MLAPTINNISELLGIAHDIIPNIITFIVVVTLVVLALRGALEWISVLLIYALTMGVLTILGIDSVFNIISILKDLVGTIVDLIF